MEDMTDELMGVKPHSMDDMKTHKMSGNLLKDANWWETHQQARMVEAIEREAEGK